MTKQQDFFQTNSLLWDFYGAGFFIFQYSASPSLAAANHVATLTDACNQWTCNKVQDRLIQRSLKPQGAPKQPMCYLSIPWNKCNQLRNFHRLNNTTNQF